jgi:pre-rRNA-processing protein RIX1
MNLISTTGSGGAKRGVRLGSPFLNTVLQMFQLLIPNHPTIFRPFASQIHGLLLPLIAPTTSESFVLVSNNTAALARQLFISLHNCAPKNTSAEEWASALRATISWIHHTADQIFRSVIEEWESSDLATRQQALKPQDFSQVVSDAGSDPLGLPPWTGIHEGIQRLTGALQLLATFVAEPTNSTVSVPMGSIIDVTNRMISVTVPNGQNGLKMNPEITREEREALFASLPSIHVTTLGILLMVLERLEHGALSITYTVLEQVLWIFETESWNKDIRIATYTILNTLLPLLGPSLTQKSVISLNPIIKASCTDVMTLRGAPIDSSSPESTKTDSKNQLPSTSTNADAFLATSTARKNSSSSTPKISYPSLLHSASTLLPSLLTHLPTEHISPPIRTEIDRSAILLSHKQAMLASVLNPPIATAGAKTTHPSILPFLARAFPSDPEVEALLRPRMPVLFTGSATANLLDEDGTPEDALDSSNDLHSPQVPTNRLDPVLEEIDRDQDHIPQTQPHAPAAAAPQQLPPLPQPQTPTQTQPQAPSFKSSPAEEEEEEDVLDALSAALNSPQPASAPSTDAILKRASLAQEVYEMPVAKRVRVDGAYGGDGPFGGLGDVGDALGESSMGGRGVSGGMTGEEGGRDVGMNDALGSPALAMGLDKRGLGDGAGREAEDDSDSDIPVLNIEQDTSDDEEEEKT